MPLSLRIRVSLLLGLASIVVLGIAAWVIDWRVDGELQQRFDSALMARTEALASLTHHERDGIEFDISEAPQLAQDARAAIWYALRCDGRLITAVPAGASALLPIERLEPGAFRVDDVQPADGGLARRAILAFQPGPDDDLPPRKILRADTTRCVLMLAQERLVLDQTLSAVDTILIVSILMVLVAVLLLTPLLVRAGLQPLRSLSEAMRDIGPQTPGRRLDIPPTPELAPLQTRFNEVLARMDAGLTRERQFASGLAHELRTRLAELRTLIEVEMRYPSDRTSEQTLAEIGSIGQELEATVAALLQLTRIESGLEHAHMRSLRLPDLLERAWSRQKTLADTRGLQIRFEGFETGGEQRGDPALLEIVLDNQLANAVAYTPKGGTIMLRCTPWGCQISNDAPNLEAADLAHFGQRFWRKREERGGHAGLGLALAAAAARAQHLRLDFALTDDGVLVATLRWPDV